MQNYTWAENYNREERKAAWNKVDKSGVEWSEVQWNGEDWSGLGWSGLNPYIYLGFTNDIPKVKKVITSQRQSPWRSHNIKDPNL